MSAFADPYSDYKAERDRRTTRAINDEQTFACLYCMDLGVVWEPLMQDAPIEPRGNPRREQTCPMCKKGKPNADQDG
jgi:hypothetical protein